MRRYSTIKILLLMVVTVSSVSVTADNINTANTTNAASSENIDIERRGREVFKITQHVVQDLASEAAGLPQEDYVADALMLYHGNDIFDDDQFEDQFEMNDEQREDLAHMQEKFWRVCYAFLAIGVLSLSA
eukprot:gene901-405_t